MEISHNRMGNIIVNITLEEMQEEYGFEGDFMALTDRAALDGFINEWMSDILNHVVHELEITTPPNNCVHVSIILESSDALFLEICGLENNTEDDSINNAENENHGPPYGAPDISNIIPALADICDILSMLYDGIPQEESHIETRGEKWERDNKKQKEQAVKPNAQGNTPDGEETVSFMFRNISQMSKFVQQTGLGEAYSKARSAVYQDNGFYVLLLYAKPDDMEMTKYMEYANGLYPQPKISKQPVYLHEHGIKADMENPLLTLINL